MYEPVRPVSPLSGDARHWLSALTRALAASHDQGEEAEILRWEQVVAWFRGRASLVLSSPKNVAVMVRRSIEGHRTQVIMGIYDRAAESAIVVHSIQAANLDRQTREQFGENDVCIVT